MENLDYNTTIILFTQQILFKFIYTILYASRRIDRKKYD